MQQSIHNAESFSNSEETSSDDEEKIRDETIVMTNHESANEQNADSSSLKTASLSNAGTEIGEHFTLDWAGDNSVNYVSGQ